MTRDEAGFTLIEALVALALGAMVVSAVLSTLHVAAAGAARAARATTEAEDFARAGTTLAADAAHAIWVDDGFGHPVFLGTSFAVDLPQLPRPMATPRPPAVVEYRIEAGRLTRTDRGEGQPVTIWQAPGALEFRFLDEAGDWQRDWTAKDRLPRAFAVTDPAAETPELVAALPDLLPLACARGPGPDCPLKPGDFP